MKKRTKTDRYHHGNLREALITAALKFLDKHPAEKLSLRTLAQNLGVSQAAPYRHFKDRDALFAAISQQGFELKYQYMMEAIKSHWSNPLELFHQCAQAYFRMGREHPQHFNLMLTSSVCPSPEYPELQRSAAMTYALLKKMIDRCQAKGVIGPGDPYRQSMHCWAMVNGFTSLYTEGRLDWLGVTDDNAPEMLRGFVEQFRLGHSVPLVSPAKAGLFGTPESSESLARLKLAEAMIGEIGEIKK